MTAPQRTMYAFALYLAGMGLGLVVAPQLLLAPFGLPAPADMWGRIAGMLVLILSSYYAVAARHGLVPLMRATVYARMGVPVFFGAFVALGWAPGVLMLFAAVDAAGALWTGWALRGDQPVPAQVRAAR